MSTMTEQRITPRDLGKVTRKVAVIVCELVNDYGIRYKSDGSHVWLYNGESKTRPYKIASSRPEETTLDFLYKWIEQNVPEYNERTVTPESLKALADAVSTVEIKDPSTATVGDKSEEGQPDVTSNGMRPVAEGRTPWMLSTGHDSGFDTDGERYYCRSCDYVKDDAQGLHLHAQIHNGTGPMSDPRAKAKMQETRRIRAEQRKVMATQAITVLAEQHGLKVGAADDREVQRLRDRVTELEAQCDDLKAKLALIKEAMRA